MKTWNHTLSFLCYSLFNIYVKIETLEYLVKPTNSFGDGVWIKFLYLRPWGLKEWLHTHPGCPKLIPLAMWSPYRWCMYTWGSNGHRDPIRIAKQNQYFQNILGELMAQIPTKMLRAPSVSRHDSCWPSCWRGVSNPTPQRCLLTHWGVQLRSTASKTRDSILVA
jgi:hypothetical protein